MNNRELLQRSLAAVWHPCTQMKQHETLPLVPIARGQGAWLYDCDGNRYLDAVSSWWVNLFGHCNPRINDAIKDQLEKLEHVMLAGFTHQPAVELSERLAQLSGLGHAFYGSDGASATEIALKMSFHFWRNRGQPGKTRFVSLENGYHGETIGALSVTDVALFKDTYAPLLRTSVQMPTPDWRYAHADENAQDFALRRAQALRSHLEQHHGETAALILEPLVQGAAGMGMYHPEYLRQARAICDEFQVHLIADEIAVGFGRSGTFFAHEQAGIQPDFLCLSKGITGGYLPLSAVLTRDPIYQAFYHDETAKGFLHSHSYTGNALACRAALAVLDIFAEDKIIAANRAKAELFNRIADPLRLHPKVRHFRNTGMIWAFEVASRTQGCSRQFFEEGLKRQVLLRPIGNTVYFMPPYVVDADEFSHLVAATLEIIECIA